MVSGNQAGVMKVPGINLNIVEVAMLEQAYICCRLLVSFGLLLLESD
jgi:hypothetical protein